MYLIKIATAVTLAIFSTSLMAQYPEWVEVRNDSEGTFSVDTANIMTHSRGKTMWTKTTFTKEQTMLNGKKYNERKEQILINCQDREFGARAFMYYQNDQVVETATFANSDFSFTPAAPGTLGEIMVDIACQ